MSAADDLATARGFAQILLDVLFTWSSEEFQRSVWIRGDHPAQYVQDYIEAVEVLCDVQPVLVDEHYYRLVPFSDEQITEFRRFYDLIERFDDQLAEHDAQHALADPQWPAITAAAGHTLSVLECGDHGLRHQVFDPYHLHPPTDTQSRILRFLLEDDFPGAAELREQAGTVSAREVAGDGVIELSVGDAPPARVDFDVPVEAHYYDMAEARHIGLVMPGPLITVQLFVSRAGFMSRLVTTYTVPKELFTRIPEIQEYEREVRVWVLLPEDPR